MPNSVPNWFKSHLTSCFFLLDEQRNGVGQPRIWHVRDVDGWHWRRSKQRIWWRETLISLLEKCLDWPIRVCWYTRFRGELRMMPLWYHSLQMNRMGRVALVKGKGGMFFVASLKDYAAPQASFLLVVWNLSLTPSTRACDLPLIPYWFIEVTVYSIDLWLFLTRDNGKNTPVRCGLVLFGWPMGIVVESGWPIKVGERGFSDQFRPWEAASREEERREGAARYRGQVSLSSLFEANIFGEASVLRYSLTDRLREYLQLSHNKQLWDLILHWFTY